MSGAKRRTPTRWELVAAGAGSGALVSIIDYTKNMHDGTITKLANALGRLFFSGASPPIAFPSPALIAILFVVFTSLFVCWLFELKDRADAFLRACSLLAAFSMVAPGTINPLSDATSVQGGTLLDRQKSSMLFVDSAIAGGELQDEAAPAGTAYVMLKNLQKNLSTPASIITVRKQDSYEPVAVFRIKSFRIPLIQTYGRQFIVQVDTPGYRSIDFLLRVKEPIEAYAALAPPTSLSPALQGMVSPLRVELTPDDAEKFKQAGRNKLIGENIEGAIIEYKRSIQLAGDDPETRHFLGYAYFRAGKNVEAREILTKLSEEFPSSSLIVLNLLKVKCALKDETAQDRLRKVNPQWRADWTFDGEFTRVCGQYLG
jgi:tetratricopeptide (TPR) repeat protein